MRSSKSLIIYISSGFMLSGLLWSPVVLAESQLHLTESGKEPPTEFLVTNLSNEMESSSTFASSEGDNDISTEVSIDKVEDLLLSQTEEIVSPRVPSNDIEPTETTEPLIVGENIVKNPKFEQIQSISREEKEKTLWDVNKATDWQTYSDKTKTQGEARVSVDEKQRLVMDSGQGQSFRGCVHQKLNIDPAKQYLVSFDIETKEKTGQAFIRIIEEKKNMVLGKEDIEKRFWLSQMTSGTAVQYHEKIYIPKLDVKSIKIELFYETGSGTVAFDNVSVREVGDKPVDKIKEVPHKLEKNIDIALNKIYVTERSDYIYRLSPNSEEIALIDKGVIKPQRQGKAILEVLNESGQLITELQLTILPPESPVATELISEWENIIVGYRDFDETNTYMHQLNLKNDRTVKKLLDTISKKQMEKYLWDDLDDLNKSATMTATFRRLEEIAKQVANPASEFYQNESVIRIVKDRLEWLRLNYYNSQRDIEGTANWWDFEIGTPRAIVNTLTVLYPYFTKYEIAKYSNVISHFVPLPTQFRSTLVNPFKAIGGNLVDMGRVKIIESLLTHDENKLRESIHALNVLFVLHKEGSKSEGFFEDGSYIDHTNVAYTGAYGNVLIDGLSQLVPLIQKTPYKLNTNATSIITGWIEKSFAPLIVHGELMDMARGRSISRENSSSRSAALEALRGIIRISSSLPTAERNRIHRYTQKELSYHTKNDVFQSLYSFSDIKMMEKLFQENDNPQNTNNTHLTLFNAMDKLAYYHAEKDFGFALSLHSNRTLNFEAMNDENVKGWYTGDGVSYIYNKDYKHYSDGYWATVNYLKLPGTTESETPRKEVTDAYLEELTKIHKNRAKEMAGMSTLPSAFVGGAKFDDRTALATMEFKNWDRTVSAKKSWFVSDDKIVFLGTDISNSSKARVVTTIEQRKDNSKNPYTVYVNDHKLDFVGGTIIQEGVTNVLLRSEDGKNNIGYIFAEPVQLEFSKDKQKGKWSDINKTAKNSNEISNDFITISQVHDKTHSNYAYTLLPNVEEQDFLRRCSRKEIEVLKNLDGLQVVVDKSQGLYAVVNYKNESRAVAPQLIVKKSGIYLFKKINETFVELSFKPLG